ncbi:paraquat-inducible protein A [Parahaliea mediterranea]|uniref:paraquat-inducible protein A n=1 Tax=Parahaliea mediterranea TaxID=651086 RepID=UPI000E2E83DB|nr:paraquat-inducible protein A [Parahaliea mediterranea]
MAIRTAREAGLVGCMTCHKLNDAACTNCSRCGRTLISRTHNALQRTYALTLVASILYIPANVLPITYTVYLGSSGPSTIFGGVVTLWQMGSIGIALVIVIASVFVPVAKLGIMFYLCEMVRQGNVRNPHQAARLYRLTEFIGRWSMIDVFVVAILVALVKLGNIISFYPGPAALSFAGVVIVTMIAAEQFDPRLLWDISKE